MPSTESKGFLLVLMQCPPALEDEFNAWYDTEHIPERLAVPGFETGLRFVCLDGQPRYLAMYDLERPEVLDSPAYLKVAFDKSSPWTKRVTSRVRVWRSFGRQVWPGSLITQRAPRLTLLRFRGVKAEVERDIVAGMEAATAGLRGLVQARILAFDTGSGIDYLGLIESRSTGTGGIDLEPFGRHAEAIDLINTYAPYSA